MVVELRVLYYKCNVENVRQCRQIPEKMCNTVFERGGFIEGVKECLTKTVQECSTESAMNVLLLKSRKFSTLSPPPPPICNKYPQLEACTHLDKLSCTMSVNLNMLVNNYTKLVM